MQSLLLQLNGAAGSFCLFLYKIIVLIRKIFVEPCHYLVFSGNVYDERPFKNISNDFFILETLSEKSPLYVASPAFMLMTYCGIEEDFSDSYGCTLDEITELQNRYPSSDITGGITPEIFLSNSITCSYDSFIDWNNGTCFFESESFISILLLAKETANSGHNYDWESSDLVNLIRHNQLLMPLTLRSISDIAYKIILDDGKWIVYIDAVTGDVIGGDMAMADKAGCFGQTNTHYYYGKTVTLLAEDGYDSLGYDTTRLNSDSSALVTAVSSFMSQSTAYGFYFRGHGNAAMTRLTTEVDGTYTLILDRSNVSGNWHFVFLDACYTASDSTWADSFNITNNHSNRAFLGWNGSVMIGRSAEFAEEFWARINTMSIRDAAVTAKADVEYPDETPIQFYGDTAYYGTSWN